MGVNFSGEVDNWVIEWVTVWVSACQNYVYVTLINIATTSRVFNPCAHLPLPTLNIYSPLYSYACHCHPHHTNLCISYIHRWPNHSGSRHRCDHPPCWCMSVCCCNRHCWSNTRPRLMHGCVGECVSVRSRDRGTMGVRLSEEVIEWVAAVWVSACQNCVRGVSNTLLTCLTSARNCLDRLAVFFFASRYKNTPANTHSFHACMHAPLVLISSIT